MAMNDVSGNNEGVLGEWSPDELIPFGKYVLLDRINSGATAAVYRANVRGEAGFERLVAIKRILPHMAGDRDFVDTFVREAKTVARLTHAGICPIYELGKVGESLYMAIEYIQGRDLGHITRRLAKRGETMPPAIAAWIAARLCDSLDYAHNLKNASGGRVGIFHRDLSPSNILVSYEGQVKLIDFGLAKAVGRAQSTNVDALKRKLGYMSPEMVKGKPVDARSDIFGVGVCLYEMITARRLFLAQNDIDTLKLVGKALVPPPSAIIDDAPEELEIIVMHALEREPEDRFQSAAEMCETLNAYLHKADPTFNSLKLSAWMHELFGEDIEQERQRIKQLLSASADPELIKQRRVFFASPSGAAARARAEIERRMSTEPPPVSHNVPIGMPRAARVPKELATAANKAPDTLRESPLRPPPAREPMPFEDEATHFYDQEKTRSGFEDRREPAGAAAARQPFEDEPTDFYDTERTRSADVDYEKIRAAEAQQSPAVGTQRHDSGSAGAFGPLANDLAPTPVPPAAATAPAPAATGEAQPFDDEPTQFMLDEELEEIAPAQVPAATPAIAGPFDFEEEATEIFFNKEEGVGLPEMLQEINDVERPAALNRPIVAPELNLPSPAAPQTGQLSHRQPTGRMPLPQVTAPPAAQWPPARPRERSTLDVELPGSAQRWPLVAAGIALLVLGIAVLIAKTPVGVAIGARAPDAGAIEVRTTPAVTANVQLDRVYRGRAPLRMDGVRVGPRRLDIEAEGYLPVTREVDVQSGMTALVDITLVPDRPSPAPTASGSQPPAAQGEQPTAP
jgi:eukaryotic-like serine/threonine-protein kinase